MTTPSTELTIIPGIEANKLALITPESASAVKAAYLPHFTTFLELEKAAQNVGVNRPKEAKIVRLDLRKVRVAADRDRKALGEEGRRYVEAVNQVYNILEDRIAPLEKRLGDIEHAEELAEKARVEAIKVARLAELTPYAATVGSDVTFYDLANMPEAQYIQLRDSTKAAADAKIAADKKVEADRIAAEQARLAREKELAETNARLAAEAAERQKALDEANRKAEEARRAAQIEADRLKKEADAKLAEERKKAAEEAARIQREADAKAAKERAENEAKLAMERKVAAEKEAKARAEREAAEKAAQLKREQEAKKAAAEQAAKDAAAKAERDKLAADAEKARLQAKKLADEAKAREEAEATRKAKEAADAAKAAKAPDKAKLLAFAKLVSNLEQVNPKLSTPAGAKLSATISGQITKFADWISTEAAKL